MAERGIIEIRIDLRRDAVCSANGIALPTGFGFENTPVEQLDEVRNLLFEKEMALREKQDKRFLNNNNKKKC